MLLVKVKYVKRCSPLWLHYKIQIIKNIYWEKTKGLNPKPGLKHACTLIKHLISSLWIIQLHSIFVWCLQWAKWHYFRGGGGELFCTLLKINLWKKKICLNLSSFITKLTKIWKAQNWKKHLTTHNVCYKSPWLDSLKQCNTRNYIASSVILGHTQKSSNELNMAQSATCLDTQGC